VSEAHSEITVASPLGPLLLVASAAGLRTISWGAGARQGGSSPVLLEAARQLEEYFGGARRAFDLPLDLRGTPFRLQAWRELARIPYGSTRSYGEQARRLGRPHAFRAVGAANGSNPLPIVLPCHRLVGSDGRLTGYGGGLAAKTWLLELEAEVAAGRNPGRVFERAEQRRRRAAAPR